MTIACIAIRREKGLETHQCGDKEVVVRFVRPVMKVSVLRAMKVLLESRELKELRVERVWK